MAPEVFDEEYGYPSDMWSAGVMMYLMLSGKCWGLMLSGKCWGLMLSGKYRGLMPNLIPSGNLPFKAKSMIDLSREVMVGKISMDDDVWKKVSKEAKELLARLLQTHPDKRATPQVRKEAAPPLALVFVPSCTLFQAHGSAAHVAVSTHPPPPSVGPVSPLDLPT